jgi:deoxyribodipyrimidine photolyase
METAIVVFTRDLRLLSAYLRFGCVSPLELAIGARDSEEFTRQLAWRDFFHQVAAAFPDLARNLGLDWRHGYRHFGQLLADGDVASNAGNWQWVAGTGNNTRPNRVMNPLRQAQRFDPAGDYVRRYVPELAAHARKASTPRTACTGQDRNTPDRSAQFCLFFLPERPVVPAPGPR